MWKYCTKQDVEDYSGVAQSDLKDSWSVIVEGLIDEHTGEQYRGVTTYSESYDGNGTDTLNAFCFFLNEASVAKLLGI